MCLNLINSMTPHKDYSGQGVTKLKYKAFSSIPWSGQFYLDPYTDFISTWLCPKIFWPWIKNSGSLTRKHSELFVSYHDDLRSERYLYLYLLWATLHSRVFSNWSRSVRYTPTSHLHTMPISLHSLVKRKINVHGAQRPILDIAIILIIVYHLVMNLKFTD